MGSGMAPCGPGPACRALAGVAASVAPHSARTDRLVRRGEDMMDMDFSRSGIEASPC
ncbi:hypothetical protein D3C72_1327850 [compost metagenome]